jgi:organic radical activating enzyme
MFTQSKIKTMTVQELIDKLAEVKNKKMKVVISGGNEPFPVTDVQVSQRMVWLENNEL